MVPFRVVRGRAAEKTDLLTQDGVTTFDFAEWRSRVASRKNDDGSISFITIDPGLVAEDAFEFVAGERGGKRVLIIRDGQHEYIFADAAWTRRLARILSFEWS